MVMMIMLTHHEVDVSMMVSLLKMICSFDYLLTMMTASLLTTLNNEHAEVRMPLWTMPRGL